MGKVQFIAIAGNIGAGKSTMVDYLCQTYGFHPFVEPNEENPFLDDFYDDMERWAFSSQISFLAHKFRIHLELMETAGTVVQDRTIYEDAEIFARHLHGMKAMSDREWETYQHLYQAMNRVLRPPDLMLYLQCGLRTTRRRIRKRGRDSEQDIPAEYLRRLNRLYGQWSEHYDLSPMVAISTERLDYISDFIHRRDLDEILRPFLT
jgi:deoxyadenosine/deoxycytidine kinase